MIRHRIAAVSDLVFHYLSTSHRKDAMLIRVNMKNSDSPNIENRNANIEMVF